MWQRHYMKILKSLCNTHLNSSPTPILITPVQRNRILNSVNPSNSLLSSPFSSLTSPDKTHQSNFDFDDRYSDNNNNSEEEEDDVGDVGLKQISLEDENSIVKQLVGILREHSTTPAEAKIKLEQCGVKLVSSDIVINVLSQLRNEWESAFLFFLWAGKQPGYSHSVREYHAMISILGKLRKFDTAWSLVDEMRGGRNGNSIVSFQTLLILIRKYCAVHDVGRAINAFHSYKRFKLDVGVEEFQGLLSALCRYKNVQDAEQLLFCNRDVYPFNVKSFNIILNGWCNIIVSPREAERFWMEMSRRRIKHDVTSYGCIISCYSKSRSLYRVMRLYEQMKKMKVEPDRKVYNAVIHALAKGRLVKEAFDMMKTMEEKGISPTIVTYNSLLKPLCKARKIEEAKHIFDEMLQRGLSPTIQTYHAFFRVMTTKEEVFALLEKMRKTRCDPTNDTYIMLIRKFCRWQQLDNVFELWDEMVNSGISPDRSSYIVLIHGLFLNGKCELAYKYYTEMKKKELLPEPKIEEILQAWKSGKEIAESQKQNFDSGYGHYGSRKVATKRQRERDLRQQPESRRVVRERGFSFWDE